jgi:hypothetical protein
MSEFDVRGEVYVQMLPISIDDEPTGAVIQALRIGNRPVPLEAFYRMSVTVSEGNTLSVRWGPARNDRVSVRWSRPGWPGSRAGRA